MKILLVTPSCHGKNVGAVQKDVYGTIELFQKMGHTVALASILSPPRTDEVPKQVAAKYGIKLFLFRPDLSLCRRLKDVLMRSLWLFDGAADVFDQMIRDASFDAFVEKVKPDAIFSFNSYSWPALAYARRKGIPGVFRSHNFESNFFWEALTGVEKFNPFNWMRRVAKYFGEKKAVQASATIATLPIEGIKRYRAWKNNQGVYIVTLGFLAKVLHEPRVHPNKKRLDIFYLGANYDVIFHKRGAEMLIEQIAPRVLVSAPGEFVFHICGAKLPAELASECVGDIIYEGYVPDLEAFLDKMDIGVFPVETGKTMKGKVFESIARAFPVVMSPNCLGGYDIKHGSEALVASSTEEFVRYILQLRDPAYRQKLAAGARSFSLRHFTEEAIREALTASLAPLSITPLEGGHKGVL